MEYSEIVLRLSLLMMLVFANGCYGCWEQDRIALLQLKASINYPYGSSSLPSWEDSKGEGTTTDCCQWERVECNLTTGRVIKLSLNSVWSGSRFLNTSVFLPFESLISLNLNWNYLEGCIENEGFEKLSSLSNLQILDLSYNSFNNSNILSSLNGLSSLKTLKLQQNKLTGVVYIQDFDSLNSLKELDISGNKLDGIATREGLETAPSLSNIEILDLSYNPFNNGNWSFLQRLPSLKTLRMEDMRSIVTMSSKDLQNLTNMENLFLDFTILNNGFLSSIQVMTSLKVLTLSNCGLTGTIPVPGLCALEYLQQLDLHRNEIRGELPQCMANLTSLRLLDLSSNHLTGNIASSPLVHLTSLVYLALSRNYFEIPITFGSFFNHSKLKVINSLNNKFVVEEEFQSLAPSFQLIGIHLSDHEFGNVGTTTTTSGTFPNFLYYQKDLQQVQLSQINFKGKFPSWLLENNTRLVRLFLPYNSFSGPLNLPSHPNFTLLELDISNNFLSGPIPDSIGTVFPSLRFLNMSGNRFSDSIPSSIGDLSSLWFLGLSNNQLSGTIPRHLAMGCFSLQFLKLSNNYLQDPILPTSHNLTALIILELDHNQLTEIPESISNCSSLQYLYMTHNNISGGIPGWMGNMSELGVLALSNNYLEGPILTELCWIKWLWYLDLSENNINGTLPSCLNSPNIRVLQLSKNGLQGTLSHAFCSSSSLGMLNLNDNRLTGGIPDCIGNLSQLIVLQLKNNHFEGNVPISLCQLVRLRLIDLSSNNLSGGIPPCLNNISFEGSSIVAFPVLPIAFSVLHYTSSELLDWNMSLPKEDEFTDLTKSLYPQAQLMLRTKGILLTYKGIVLDLISGIDLSANRLTGHIPLEIGNLSRIQFLNLSHNSLNGVIPSTFWKLESIESLDLSNNNLNGEIPSQLTMLTALAVFNVSYNNLSGSTPPRISQFGTFEEDSYAGNRLLCGEPLPRNCTVTQPGMATNGSEADDGFIDMGTFYASFAASYVTVLLAIAAVLYINPYWRQTWFYLVEVYITSCYYFVVDNLRH
ncbi:receptor-like protein 13 [Cornus florida]|uniref:receptor-like protein 13 n=1 Tax=Cornus florida TaxID=4283 RepID=UPI002897B5F1|nr:receptor-like protein 13 [Cornus florida]